MEFLVFSNYFDVIHPPPFSIFFLIIHFLASNKAVHVIEECMSSENTIVKLRSRSWSGEGQLRVRRRVRFGPELYNILRSRSGEGQVRVRNVKVLT